MLDDRQHAQAFLARDRPPLKPSGRDGGTYQSAPNAPKDAQAGREAPCNQRRKAKRQSAQAGQRDRRGRARRRTLRGVQNGDTTASRSDPKGAELTLCPAPRGAQGSAGGTQRSRAPVRAAFGRGSGGARAATPNAAACSQVNSRTSDFCEACEQNHDERRGERQSSARGVSLTAGAFF